MKKTDKIRYHLDNPDDSDLSLLDVRIDELMEHCKYLVKSQIKNHLELICYLEDFINK